MWASTCCSSNNGGHSCRNSIRSCISISSRNDDVHLSTVISNGGTGGSRSNSNSGKSNYRPIIMYMFNIINCNVQLQCKFHKITFIALGSISLRY